MTLLQHLHNKLIVLIKSKTGTRYAPKVVIVVIIIVVVVIVVITGRVTKHAYGICKRNTLET